jgi:hypothetical protein
MILVININMLLNYINHLFENNTNILLYHLFYKKKIEKKLFYLYKFINKNE